MKITDLQVHDGYIVARLEGTPPFKVKLDGWATFRPATQFSYFPDSGWIVLGSTDKPLREGQRVLSTADADGGDVVTFYMGTPPPPPPPPTWKLLLDLSSRGKWDGIHESAPGARITDESDGSIRLYKPQKGERCEVSQHDERIGNGGTFRYSWDFRIDPTTVLNPANSGLDGINQQHGDEKSGYGGGLTVRVRDHMLVLRVKGGKRLSASGSQRYEYESDGKGGSDAEPAGNVEVGKVTIGQRHHIEVEARWSKAWDGFVRARLDGGPWVGVEDVPTMCEPANVQMFYLGWYDSGGTVPKDMKVWDAKVEVPA